MTYMPVVGQAESPPIEMVPLADQAEIDMPEVQSVDLKIYPITSNEREDPGLHSETFTYDYNVTELRVVHGAIYLHYKQDYSPPDIEPARLIV